MAFKQPELPYALNALEGTISQETMEYHYGKHHAAYFTNLNKIVEGTEWEQKSLEDNVRECTEGGHYNNASQAWNHVFFWDCMSASGGGEPSGALADKISADFGDFAAFKDAFSKASVGQFGSGWGWLALDKDGKLKTMGLPNGDTPIRHGMRPVLGLDVWEHAYYIDYRNARPKYVEAFWDIVNWAQCDKNLAEDYIVQA